MALTDQNQSIASTYAYQPYGEQTQGQTQTITQPFTYVGQYGVMAESYGYYYMRARYYDSGAGRFVSEDPLVFDGGDVNLYAYVAGNPVGRVDPSGLITLYTGFSGTVAAPVIGKATLGTGQIAYSPESGWFDGNWITAGMNTPNDVTAALSLGAGPTAGFFTEGLAAFQGATNNKTLDLVIIGLTYSTNESGWGFSVSAGGKGFGLGYYENTTITLVDPKYRTECKGK